MRQIKFRGKLADNGEWVYGELYTPKLYDSKRGYFGEDVPCIFCDEGGVPVIPDTIGQYTGLNDCNGKEIYEGDILGASGRIIGYVIGGVRGYCYDVVFINHSAGEKTWPLYSTVKYDYPYEITVIGNIHDNSSLFK